MGTNKGNECCLSPIITIFICGSAAQRLALPAARVEQSSKTGNCHSSETTPKNAQSPSRTVHLRMMAGNHFPPKNVRAPGKESAKVVIFEEKGSFFTLSSDVLRTLCWALLP